MSTVSSSPEKTEKKEFQADWNSLQAYECPDWFRDAKFGIYAHWGPYSAIQAAGNTDWYSRHMYQPGSEHRAYQEKTYGPLDEFGYKDFIPMFTAENFDAEEWADLYVESGARFAGPVAEHADGFAMWDSEITKWNSAKMGPKRDIVAEMKKAIEARGLKFMTSFHHHWKWGWYPTMDEATDASNPDYEGLYGPPAPDTAFGVGKYDPMRPRPLPPESFAQEWLEKVNEVVDLYSPEMIWFDNRMEILPEEYIKKMAAHFYNKGEERDLDYVLTFKRPDMPLGTGTVDLERNRMPDIFPEPWLTDTSVASNTWSASSDINYYSSERIIHDFVDIVSKNGCLLLNLAPDPDGSIPAEQKQLLRDIGAWLKLNGEAIYDSRPWLRYGEGPTETPVGHLADESFDGWSGEDIRFTTNNGFLYAHAYSWPTDGGSVLIRCLGEIDWNEQIKNIELLGSEGVALDYSRDEEGLKINVPADIPDACKYVLVFKISY